MPIDRIVVKAKNFDVSKVSFGKQEKHKSVQGASRVPMLYDGSPFLLQTPEMRIPFTVSYYDPARSGKNKGKKSNDAEESSGVKDEDKKWSLNLSFDEEDKNPELSDFHEKMDDLHELVLQAAIDNVWAPNVKARKPEDRKKSLGRETINNLLGVIVKQNTQDLDDNGDPKYPATLNVKVPYYDGKFTSECFSEKAEPMTEPLNEVLTSNSRAICLLNFNQVFVGAAAISYKPSLHQAKVKQFGSRSKGPDFIDSDEENENEDERQTNEVVDSDDDNDNDNDDNDDNEDDSSDEEEPIVVKKKNKKNNK